MAYGKASTKNWRTISHFDFEIAKDFTGAARSVQRTGFVCLVSCSIPFLKRRACWGRVTAKTGIDSIAWHIGLYSSHMAVCYAQTTTIVTNGCPMVLFSGQIDFSHSPGSQLQYASSGNPTVCFILN